MKRCHCGEIMDTAFTCTHCGDVMPFECECDQLRAEVERLRAERRWIPISERLPEVGKDVFACHSLHRCVWIQAFNKSGVWIGYEPTHWMPLPPLPEKVQV